MPSLSFPRSLSRRAPAIRKWANVGAWFFIVFSLASVGWALARQWADPGGTTALYGDAGHQAWALTYSGIPGLLAALAQFVAVGVAALLSTLHGSRLRKTSNRILLGWAGLWWLNLLWLASVDLRFDSFCQAAIMSALFGCTAYRALRRPAPRLEGAPDDPPIIVADDGIGIPGEVDTPPAPLSHVGRVKAKAREIAAGPWKERVGTAVESAKRGVRRLQNGWKTTSV